MARSDPRTPEEHRPARWLLHLTVLGVVYGDIGTSPLYALRECFHGLNNFAPTAANILGVVSMIFFSLIAVVSVKYLLYIMRADNRGQGGILALLALTMPRRLKVRGASGRFLLAAGLVGAALLYGDSVITPAISVLSAVEGLTVATNVFEPYVVPITVGVLLLLFLFQRRGTKAVGSLFGPVILVWFLVIGVLGAISIVSDPSIFRALNPLHAVSFFLHHGWTGLIILGAVFLAVTGTEALYADMGHFGRSPIRRTWFSLVLPCLVLNYFGQGALLLRSPAAVINPFYLLAPEWGIYPLVALSTVATVIASQAVISAAFSLTAQAVALGYLPRLNIVHTSAEEEGQVYVPVVNALLMVVTIVLVLQFRSSSKLAAAYGVAVSLDMVITTLLAFAVARRRWRWHLGWALPLTGILLAMDLTFFGANIVKIANGGWIPLAMAVVLFTIMTTWRRGRELLSSRLQAKNLPLKQFMAEIHRTPPARVPRTAVFMTASDNVVPPALVLNTRHNVSLHERVIFLSVLTDDVPYVQRKDRLEVEELGEGFYRLRIHYGFMDRPNVPRALELAVEKGLPIDPASTTFFLGRETIVSAPGPKGMAPWREKLFAFLARNAQKAPAFFKIPSDNVLEVGTQIEF